MKGKRKDERKKKAVKIQGTEWRKKNDEKSLILVRLMSSRRRRKSPGEERERERR